MTVPATPSPTCQITWIENGQIVTDGQPAVVVAYLYYRRRSTEPDLAPMVSMCQQHFDQLNSRQYIVGLWSHVKL